MLLPEPKPLPALKPALLAGRLLLAARFVFMVTEPRLLLLVADASARTLDRLKCKSFANVCAFDSTESASAVERLSNRANGSVVRSCDMIC